MNHLDIATDYSFMRAYGKPKQVCDRVQMIGGDIVGVADYLSTWGHLPIAREAAARGMRVVYGCKFPVVCNPGERDPRHNLVGLFATTRDGLSEIYRLVGVAADQMYYRPRLSWRQVTEAREKGVASIAYQVDNADIDRFAEAGCYVPLGLTDSMLMRAVLGGEYDDRLIFAASPTHPTLQDRKALDTMLQCSRLVRIGEALNALKHVHILRKGEAISACTKAFGIPASQVEAAIERSAELADSWAIQDFGRATLIPAPADWSLRKACLDGLHDRGLAENSAYIDRLDHELAVIEPKGFASYFYFVARVVSWASDRMLVGPGRGSAGGCLVAYALGITAVDPIVHGTLFERFIDPSRSDMPDIDVDFQDSKRDLVFDKLAEWYGEGHVARIGTVSYFGAKSALNEVARYEKTVPFDQVKILGLRAEGLPISLDVLFEVDDVCKDIVGRYPPIRAATTIEGHARHHGVHAAGVCVANEPVTNFAAVVGKRTAALTMDDAAGIDFLKFDALGLTTLSVIADTCEQLGMDPFSLRDKPLDDDLVYEVFRRDEVTGVFQFEGSTVRGLMRAIHVDKFSDLTALVAIARPGPLQGGSAEGWVKRRSGQQDWSFEHDLLEPITKSTYGLIIYEEQMMKILTDIAGFSIDEVNKVRKSIKKKDPEILHGFEKRFIEGAGAKIGHEMADCLWHSICEFGAYAFNLAHSVAYAMVSYQAAWLRAYHPAEFALSLLRYTADPAKCKMIIRQLGGRGISFVAFDPNLSEVTWSIKDSVLYGGFTGLIGIGEKTARNKLIPTREEHGEDWLRARGPKGAIITEAMRAKLDPLNTPWADIDFIGRQFAHLFADPRANNIGADRIYRIDEIPHAKGSYIVIGKVIKTMEKDQNEPARVARRNGQRVTGQTKFLNLILDDDGIQIGATINAHKFLKLGKPILEDGIGKYVLLRADILGGDGPKWLMVDRLRPLEVESFQAEEDS